MVALGAVVPLVVVMASSVVVAGGNPARALTLVTDPVGSLVTGLPAWYPAPMILLWVLPLVGLSAKLMFFGGSGLQALGIAGHRVATVVAAVLGIAAGAAAIVFGVNLISYFPDVLISVGVVVAAWAGGFALWSVLPQSTTSPEPLRFGMLASWLVSSGLGFGLISSSVGWLQWQGYLFPVLSNLGLIDLAPAHPGVLVALVVSALVALIAGLGASRRSTVVADD
jgi:nucleobase:cation symporter-1, NCS1 family